MALKLTAEFQPSTGKFRVVDAFGYVYASGVDNWQTAHALAGIYQARQHKVGPSSNPDAQRRERNRRPPSTRKRGSHVNYHVRDYGM